MSLQKVEVKMPAGFSDDILSDDDGFFFRNDASGFSANGGYYAGCVFGNSCSTDIFDESYKPSSDEIDRVIGILKDRNIKLLLLSAAAPSAIPWAERIVRPIAEKLKELGLNDVDLVLLQSNRWFQYNKGIAYSSRDGLTPEDIERTLRKINSKSED
jgi:hypothetical protein